MKIDFRRFATAFAVVPGLLMLFLTGCNNNDDAPATPEPLVTLRNSATLGNYLTDKDGNTLYFFTRDADGTNNCTGGCAALWPVFHQASLTQDQLGTGLQLTDFAEITTAGGQKQTTYKGWPLYYYAPSVSGTNTREAPGETRGEAVGTVWYVAKPDYSVMLANRQLTGADGKRYRINASGTYEEGDGVTQYFTDGKGRTLYIFTADRRNTNTCTSEGCRGNWPVFTDAMASVPSTLDKTLFGSIDAGNNRRQVTYKGWPLYYFAQDANRGENKGVSVPRPGVWPVATRNAPDAPN